MLAGRAQLPGQDPTGERMYGGAKWGVSLVTVPPRYPGACHTTRLKQASMRGWRVGRREERNILFTRRKRRAPQRQGRGSGGDTQHRGGSLVTCSGGARGTIQPLPPPMGAKNKHPPLAHPWEHPLVPRSILGRGTVCPLGTGVGSRVQPGEGYAAVAFPLWVSMTSVCLSRRDWQDTRRRTGDGGGMGGIYRVPREAPARGDAIPHHPPKPVVPLGHRCGGCPESA